MNHKRRLEIDEIIKPLTEEFKASSLVDGKYGVFYMSNSQDEDDFHVSLECEREAFKRMMATLMDMDEKIAEDILEAAKAYCERRIVVPESMFKDD